jgi:hypothetical protein
MSIDRHLFGAGLVVDDVRKHRYFFPSKDGGPNEITWTPRKKKARRVVAKPIFRDGKFLFWRHLGAYLKVVLLVNKFYIQITPTWVLTGDGEHAQVGPDIGRHVIKWTGAERNMQILYHIRFWTFILRRGRGGPISIRAGDQSIEVATVPAMIQQSWGISGDYENLWDRLDDNASTLAAEEEEDLVDDAFEIEVEDIKSEDSDGVEEDETTDESDQAQ